MRRRSRSSGTVTSSPNSGRLTVVADPRVANGDAAISSKTTLALATSILATGSAFAASVQFAHVGSAANLHPDDVIVGKAADNQAMHIEVALKMRNSDVLNNFVAAMHAQPGKVAPMDSANFLANHAPTMERAQAVGADAVIDARSDVAAQLHDWVGTQGPTVVIDATGSPAAIRSAFDFVAAAGRIVIVGISDRDVAVPVIAYSRKELTVLGSRNSVRMFPEAIQLVRQTQDKIRSIITHLVTLGSAPDIIELALAHPEVVEKAVILF